MTVLCGAETGLEEINLDIGEREYKFVICELCTFEDNIFHFNSFLPTLPESSKVICSTWDVWVGLLLVAASVF